MFYAVISAKTRLMRGPSDVREAHSKMMDLLKLGPDVRPMKVLSVSDAVNSGVYDENSKIDLVLDKVLDDLSKAA